MTVPMLKSYRIIIRSYKVCVILVGRAKFVVYEFQLKIDFKMESEQIYHEDIATL